MSNYTCVVTLGPIGYLPAPGTMASLVSLPLVYLLLMFFPLFWYVVFLGVLLFSAYYAIGKSIRFFVHEDPSEIVLDEVVGCLITFMAVPYSPLMILLGFCFFRFFDIIKPLGVARCEKLKGAQGILCDDMLAGVYSNLLLQAIWYFFY